MPLPEVMNGLQALAWITWRTEEAVALFSGEDAEELWEAARVGEFPHQLGKPIVTPVAAEREFDAAIAGGKLPTRTR